MILQLKNSLKTLHSRLLKKGYAFLYRLLPVDFIADRIFGLENEDYQRWISSNEPTPIELAKQRRTKFEYLPKVSIIVPVYNPPARFLVDMLESVRNQTYSNWELCIADGSTQKEVIKPILTEYRQLDERIKVKFIAQNRGIAGNSNEAVSLATGDYIALLDHDDTLASFALFEVVKAINENRDAELIYSDEDKISEDDERRIQPFFKPDYSPDTLRTNNYICHLAVFKNQTAFTKWFDAEIEGSQDYDLILRISEKAEKIVHIPKILYHWRISSGSTAKNFEAKGFGIESEKRAIKDHLIRTKVAATVEEIQGLTGYYQIRYGLKKKPLISIVVFNNKSSKDLKRCLFSIQQKSTYPRMEVLVVEPQGALKKADQLYQNGSKPPLVKMISAVSPFHFSRAANWAAKEAKGEILLFLNPQTEVKNPDWLERLAEHAVRQGVGAVGGKIWFSNQKIQHAGMILGVGGTVGQAYQFFSGFHSGYFGRLKVVQNLMAVSGDCLMIRKALFEEVSGFDENFANRFYDVDLCLRLREKGYLIVWTPHAELFSHAFKIKWLELIKERGLDTSDRSRLKKRWAQVLEKGDPYYNPNLTLENSNFEIKNNI